MEDGTTPYWQAYNNNESITEDSFITHLKIRYEAELS